MTLAQDYITPGPNKLINGNREAGYFGSLSASEMGRFVGGSQDGKYVTASTLAEQVGIAEGTPQNEEIIFHKFIYKNEILYIPQKTIRYAISWNDIAEANCVFGRKEIQIGDSIYKVTLLSGLSKESTDYDDVCDSEWEALWPLTGLSDKNIGFACSDTGFCNWCQETISHGYADDGFGRSLRGGWHRGESGGDHAHIAFDMYGWRPALRLKPQ